LSIRERKSSAWFSKMLLFQLFYILKIAQIWNRLTWNCVTSGVTQKHIQYQTG
jgi:hypothetical protein